MTNRLHEAIDPHDKFGDRYHSVTVDNGLAADTVQWNTDNSTRRSPIEPARGCEQRRRRCNREPDTGNRKQATLSLSGASTIPAQRGHVRFRP
jgi:hypothetical protein